MRRLMVAVLMVTAVLASATASAAVPTTWTHDGYGPGNTGYNPAESVVNASSIKKLKQKWSVTIGPGDPGCGPAPVAPAVVDGRVFLHDGGVAAYDLKTGKRLWINQSFSLLRARLVVVGGLVIATDTNCYSNSNYDGTVTALDVRTGVRKWSGRGSWTVDTIVADAGVIVTSGYCGTCDDAPYGVVAYRVSDGKQLWTALNTVLGGPVSAGGRIVLSRTTSPETWVAPIATGSPAWGTGGKATARAANPAGDQLYLWDSTELRAVNAKTATTQWRIRSESGELAADGRRVYVASAGRINSYDAATGKLLWTRAVSGPGRPIRAGGLLYTVTSAKTLVVLSPVDGKPVAYGATHAGLTDHVVVAGGVLFLTRGANVRAYAP